MMDPKASAKAKRSYSQQGRRKHPSPATIAQKKKAAQAGPEGKVQRAYFHGLPSNLDRYDDGEEEAESSSGATLEEGEIPPKSKGADFAYLIEQARSQQHELRASAVPESPSFFDELATDFMEGLRSIHTVRRKNILSRFEDDNFVVDDDLTSRYEIPFLNLDLHAIAAQLSKLKLSERLFIEEDLLPVDLRSVGSKDSSSSSFQSKKLGEIKIGKNLEAPDSYLCPSPAKDVLGHTDGHNTSIFPNPNIPQVYPTKGNEQETTVGVNLGQQSDKREAEESLANISKTSTLKVRDAEAELDILLDSFKETSLSGSMQGDLLGNKAASKISSDESLPFHWKPTAQNPSFLIRNQQEDAELDMLFNSSKENSLTGSIQGSLLHNSSNSRAPNSDFFNSMRQQLSRQGHVSSKNTVIASIDDSIDDLLAETSSILKMQKLMRATSRSPALAPAPELGSMVSTTNPSLPHSSSSSIDDLLGGHKSILTQNGVASSKGHSSQLGSDVQMDDFDSWMDSF